MCTCHQCHISNNKLWHDINIPAIRGKRNGKAVEALEDVGAFVLLNDHHKYDVVQHHHNYHHNQ